MSPKLAKTRLFVDGDLAPGRRVVLGDGQAHYLGHVMRLGQGDPVALFNGRDGEWLAWVTEAARKGWTVTADACIRPQRREPDIWLAFAPVKKTRTDFLVEKATELGVSRLCPVFTRRTATARVNLARLGAQAKEAAEQCGRLTVPDVASPLELSAFAAAWPAERPLLVADETGGGAPIAEVVADGGEGLGPMGILVGPEGGFDPSELDLLVGLPFVTPVGLGPRVLRAETAALSVLACWQALCGDLREAPPRRRP